MGPVSRFAETHPTFVRLYVPVMATATFVVALASLIKGCTC